MYFEVFIIEHKDFSLSKRRELDPLWWYLSSPEDGVLRRFTEGLRWFSRVGKSLFTLCNISKIVI